MADMPNINQTRDNSDTKKIIIQVLLYTSDNTLQGKVIHYSKRFAI